MHPTRVIRNLPALLALAAATAAAQPIGPGVQDLPPVVRPADEIDRDLTLASEQLTQALRPTQPDSRPLGEARAPLAAAPGAEPAPAAGASTVRTATALAGVLCVIGGLAWIVRRVARVSGGLGGALGAGGRAPAGLVEVLARYPLGHRQTLVVLRFDRRVLLCSQSAAGRAGAASMTTLCELTEAEDVASVLIKARDEAGESIARGFERTLREAERLNDAALETESIRVRVGQGRQGAFR
jgi:flagellar biogenesis protein FliO